MTRRERLERKLELRREWADKREASATAEINKSFDMVSGIPMGQPILIGHHSEKGHRALLARSDAAMRRGCEDQEMAKHHDSKADGIERQLDGSIFSDDPDAVEALEARIAGMQAEHERMKAINKALKAKALDKLDPPLTEAERKELDDLARCWGNVYPAGFPSYALSNSSANIRRLKQRIEEIKKRQARTEKAEAATGGVLIEGTEYVRVTFAEKPDRSVLNDLKAADFRWGGGSWCGRRDKLPPSVLSPAEESGPVAPE